jgi:hypothetical protein
MTLVAPSLSQTPVPPSDTCITCRAKSHAGWTIVWCAAVIEQLAV